MIKVEYFGHSCFKLSCDASSIVLDPYKMEDYPELRVSANRVSCSHSHFDHNYAEAVTIISESAPFAFSLRYVESFHDDEGGAKRGANKIAVLEAEEMSIVHLGDLGHELSVKQCEEIGKVDLLLVPVGGFFTIDAETAYSVMRALKPRVLVPMHYRVNESAKLPIADVGKFLELCADDGIKITRTGAFFELSEAEPEGVVLMSADI